MSNLPALTIASFWGSAANGTTISLANSETETKRAVSVAKKAARFSFCRVLTFLVFSIAIALTGCGGGGSSGDGSSSDGGNNNKPDYAIELTDANGASVGDVYHLRQIQSMKKTAQIKATKFCILPKPYYILELKKYK